MLVSSELDALASVHAEAITTLVGFALIYMYYSNYIRRFFGIQDFSVELHGKDEYCMQSHTSSYKQIIHRSYWASLWSTL